MFGHFTTLCMKGLILLFIMVTNPNNNNRGGVGICFKEFLAARQVELNNLNE